MKERVTCINNRPVNLRTIEQLLWNFGGQKYMGCQLSQYQVDLVLWELFLNKTSDIRAIVELGTGRGGMTLFLALQAYQRGLEFWTFDWVEGKDMDSPLARLLNLREHYVISDIFTDGAATVIDLLTEKLSHPLLLFCDNGRRSKDREFNFFVPHLRNEDYVAVHDWHTSIEPATLEQFGDSLSPLDFELWERADSITRFLKVVA